MNHDKTCQYIGTSTGCDDAYGKVTGSVRYCADLLAPGQLHMRLCPAEITHGRIVAIDITRAEKMPGVRAVYTWQNTPDRPYDRGRVIRYENVTYQERLFDPHIRYRGERIAAVVADTEEHAAAACRAITAEYEEYPAALTPEQALREDAPEVQVYPPYGDVTEPVRNRYDVGPLTTGDYDSCSAEHVHTSRTHLSRMTHLTLETQACRARYDRGKDLLTVWTGTQISFGIRSTVADLVGLPYARVRVIKTPMGGSFGCRQEAIVEPLAAYAAYDLRADVLLSYTREEQIGNAMLKHNVDFAVESKTGSDGTIEGMRISAVLDAGAYTTVSHWFLGEIGSKSGKVYRIPNLDFRGICVNTNTPVNGSFRSWGSSDIAAAMENHINIIAKDLGIDPVEFRLRNVHLAHEEDLLNRRNIGKTHFTECLTL
ncbi:MAG: molybdopterin-dependent oxidoreductase [Mogibacterium sp.]|nr:molybdopterin-dependent oxidoreductase [Mogibacterium sp.]